MLPNARRSNTLAVCELFIPVYTFRPVTQSYCEVGLNGRVRADRVQVRAASQELGR